MTNCTQPDSHAVRAYLQDLQQHIVARFDALEARLGKQPSRFQEESWERLPDNPENRHNLSGHGIAHVLENGEVLEKAGINFSDVRGPSLPPSATRQRPELEGAPFQAMGVSLVIHPKNPYVPTSHANVRFFIATPKDREPVWWFGGGFDLTPYYGFTEDAVHWHTVARAVCSPFGESIYPTFKKQCDEYFFLKHRNENRGIGGLFFDDFNQLGFGQSFALTRNIGDAYLDAYVPIVERRVGHPYGERERAFQEYRRGRYVEFNLLYDRGTLFGLQSGGKTESILMSLPPIVRWRYNWSPDPGSPEADLYHTFLKPRDWLAGSTANPSVSQDS